MNKKEKILNDILNISINRKKEILVQYLDKSLNYNKLDNETKQKIFFVSENINSFNDEYIERQFIWLINNIDIKIIKL